MESKQFILKVYRGSPGDQYWEKFKLSYTSGENVIGALMRICKSPFNHLGERVAPIVWEDGCLEEVCGSCSMLINGTPRQACTALIEECMQEEVITLAPFTKFPLLRDLIVDRSRMFEQLKEIHGWITPKSSQGWGPKVSPQKQELMYKLSTCMTCGCCSEACPQVNDRSDFIGPAPISQVHLFNTHPAGREERAKRTHSLMGRGGVSECGNAQNCQRVCPKGIPLTESITAMGRAVALQAVKDLWPFKTQAEDV